MTRGPSFICDGFGDLQVVQFSPASIQFKGLRMDGSWGWRSPLPLKVFLSEVVNPGSVSTWKFQALAIFKVSVCVLIYIASNWVHSFGRNMCFMCKLVPKTGLERRPLVTLCLLEKLSSELKHKKTFFHCCLFLHEGDQHCTTHILSIFIIF